MITFTIISAIICLIIVFLTMLNMYEPIYCGGYNLNDKQQYERIKVPLYVYIIAVIACVIPIFNIIAIIGYITWCICKYIESDMIIKGPMGKIGKFLNKKL